jgi:hypothetical protein
MATTARVRAGAHKVGDAAEGAVDLAGSAVTTTARKANKVAKAAAGKAEAAIRDIHGPSPNPMTNLVIADIALRGGGRLVKQLVERSVLGAKYSPERAKEIVKGRSMVQTLLGTAVARIATRSVPGALLVGGGLLAKTLYDRSQSRRKARAEGEAKLMEQAEDA